jgi:hypothetical protein
VLPVTVAPETLDVKVPETPVIVVERTVSPVITAPDTWEVNTPDTPVTFVNCAVVPVTVVPDKVPVTVTPLANIAVPVTVKSLTVRLVTLREGVTISWKLPVVALTVVPVMVVPVRFVKVPFV